MQNGGGGGVKDGFNAFICVSLHLESHSRKALISSAAPYAFNTVFFKQKLYDIHVTRFDRFLGREGDSALH